MVHVLDTAPLTSALYPHHHYHSTSTSSTPPPKTSIPKLDRHKLLEAHIPLEVEHDVVGIESLIPKYAPDQNEADPLRKDGGREITLVFPFLEWFALRV